MCVVKTHIAFSVIHSVSFGELTSFKRVVPPLSLLFAERIQATRIEKSPFKALNRRKHSVNKQYLTGQMLVNSGIFRPYKVAGAG